MRNILLFLSLCVGIYGIILAAVLKEGLLGFIAFILCSLIFLLIIYVTEEGPKNK